MAGPDLWRQPWRRRRSSPQPRPGPRPPSPRSDGLLRLPQGLRRGMHCAYQAKLRGMPRALAQSARTTQGRVAWQGPRSDWRDWPRFLRWRLVVAGVAVRRHPPARRRAPCRSWRNSQVRPPRLLHPPAPPPWFRQRHRRWQWLRNRRALRLHQHPLLHLRPPSRCPRLRQLPPLRRRPHRLRLRCPHRRPRPRQHPRLLPCLFARARCISIRLALALSSNIRLASYLRLRPTRIFRRSAAGAFPRP